MPYIIRNASGQITRATVHAVPGAEMVPYQHPDLVAFLRTNGQDPQAIEDALAELRRTDGEMARAVEDVVTALLKKNILKLSDLPKPVQDRMALRVRLRVMIQDALDQASGQQQSAELKSGPSPSLYAPATTTPFPQPPSPTVSPYQN